MIKGLRKKFILIAMVSIAIVLFIIMTGINIANYVSVNVSANERLELLSDNGGEFPDMFSEMMNGTFDPTAAPADNTGSDESALPSDSTPQKPESDDGAANNSLSDTEASNDANTSDGNGTGESTTPPELPDDDSSNNRNGNDKEFKDNFKTLSAESPYDTRFYSVVFAEDGTVSEVNLDNIVSITEDEATATATELYSKGKTGGFSGSYKYRATETVDSDGNTITLYVFVDCSQELRTFREFLIASIAISAGGLLLVFLLVLFFSNLVLKPITESYTKQKRFITDASHEIKTPLTIIDANTEIIEMTYGEDEWTESTRNQIKRLTDLTNKLVFLSRMDEESNTTNMIDFNLSDAVIDTIEPFKAVAQAKNKSILLDVDDEIHYKGDEGQIRQAVSLLVDNSVKYATEGTPIKITLKNTGKNRIFTIENQADNIEPGKHDELFERFYRPDASRNSKTGGHGIGLSVVWAIVNAHKGKITAKSEDGRSLKFTMTL